ncbi:hypothetical protein NW752_010826 [Fusarium irregulare]|uniref:Rhodopsin domain-containing protein n=1 Tax=Fusarium irregulare TaxID=2494466 RepID=A0A9W8PG75_9HYPO|nr:hypothetical protein NW766_011953 [Fusarium irregulare]KAJ4006179.1 hypothetical protein NW752_010826 [Fusarium irregulare]
MQMPFGMIPQVYLMDPPPGYTRQPENPPSSAGGVIPAGATLTGFALIIVIIRIFTRKWVVKGPLGVDDYLCIASMIFSFGFLAATLTLLTLGVGNHMWDITIIEYVPKFWQTSTAANLIYCATISMSKLSVLSFYLRISPDKFVRRAVYGTMALVCAYSFTYVMIVIFRCWPISAGWDPLQQDKCFSLRIHVIYLVTCSVVVDAFLMVIPFRIVQPLQIPRRQKVGLAVLFATGGSIIIVTIRRLTITLPMLKTIDYTWHLPPQLILSFIEVNLSIVVVSIPALKPFFKRYIPFLIHSGMRSSPKASKNSSHREKNKSNPTGSDESYELTNRKTSGHMDDETRLCYRDPEQGLPIDEESRPESIDSAGDRLPSLTQKPEPAVVSFSTKHSSSVGGIEVSRETVITYGQAV